MVNIEWIMASVRKSAYKEEEREREGGRDGRGKKIIEIL